MGNIKWFSVGTIFYCTPKGSIGANIYTDGTKMNSNIMCAYKKSVACKVGEEGFVHPLHMCNLHF